MIGANGQMRKDTLPVIPRTSAYDAEYSRIMSLRQMSYLLVVVEEQSFTRAAQRIGISQSALSHQIQTLERGVGGPLLERLPTAVYLTPMGRAYLPHAAAALRSAEQAEQSVGPQAEAPPGNLRIGTLFSPAMGILPPAIRALRATHPHTHIELREFPNVEELVDFVNLGVADVGVGPVPPRWEGPQTAIGAEELVIVLAADDELTRRGARETVKLAELADRQWVLYTQDNGLEPLVIEACQRAGFEPVAGARTRHTATGARLAAAGLGPALVPRSIIDPDLDATILGCDPPVYRELVAFTPPEPSSLVSELVRVLVAHGPARRRDPR